MPGEMRTVAVTCPTRATFNSFLVVRNLIIRALAGRVVASDAAAGADLHVHVGLPELAQRAFYDGSGDTPLVFYSFAEATSIPPHWTETFNRCAEVWVPSEFSRAVFRACGVTVPIRLVPLGVDPPRPGLEREDAPAPVPVTILWQGTTLRRVVDGRIEDGDRKRGHLVETAFRRAALPDSRLVLKWIPYATPACEMRAGAVWYLCSVHTPLQTARLDRAVDLFVWPTMGEGFGLVPLEKMARGSASLVTNWSGPTEYLPDYPGAGLDGYELREVTFNGVPAQMAVVDPEALVEALRSAHARRDELRAGRAERARITAERWSFERKMRPAVVEAVDRMLG